MSSLELDEILDKRARIRDLRKKLDARKVAYFQAKRELREAEQSFEVAFSDLEVKQGRLAFEGESPKTRRKDSAIESAAG
jgi:hypothetical protein